jgi:hypothetical protein
MVGVSRFYPRCFRLTIISISIRLVSSGLLAAPHRRSHIGVIANATVHQPDSPHLLHPLRSPP